MGTSLADLDHAVDEDLASQPPHGEADSGGTTGGASAGHGPVGSAPASAAPAATPAPAGSDAPAADLGVSSNWWQGLQSSVQNLTHAQPPAQPRSSAQQAVATARAVQGVVGSVMGALSVPGDMLNAGFANLTGPIAKILPSFPAATITMLYVGMPHTHSHPPSLVPPAPPIPMPSLGAVTLGTSVKVLINGMPAARCGDIGLAPTCCGLAPFFQIKTGSSNTFIGGNRAARMLDICQVCATADTRNKGTINAGAVMGAIGSAARGIQAVQKGMGYAAIAMDAVEAATEDDGAMQAAKAMGAAMAAAQMAADAAAAALSKAMGTDPAVISPRSMGAIVVGHPNVLIGGFPMVNIPNPAEMLLKRLARYKRTPPPKRPPGHCGKPECD
jgi:uncharacterized Zn-binding protein involved in type VI secretion